MVVDYDGRILAQADPGPGEKVVTAPIDLDSLRAERERRSGHDMRAHLRSELYDYLQHPYFPAASPNEHPLTGQSICERTRRAKGRTQGAG
jgi:hypothetical protein